MKKRLTLFFCLFVTFLNAQKNYKKGYVIKISNDTIYGEINYLNDKHLRELCVFKSKQGVVEKYNPSQIKAFRFENSKYFLSREVGGELIFLEFLVKGKLNVFADYNGEENRFYVQKDNTELTLLDYEEGIKEINGTSYFYQTNNHIDKLKDLTEDSPKSTKKAEFLKKPDYKNLIRFAEDYHENTCNDECVVFVKKESSIKVNFEILYGLYNTKDYGNTSHLGALANIRPSRNNENLFITIGYLRGNSKYENARIPVYLTYVWPGKKNFKYMASWGASRFAPTMSVGVYYKVFKNIRVGVRAITWFGNKAEDNKFFKASIGALIPNTGLDSYSLLGGVMIDL